MTTKRQDDAASQPGEVSSSAPLGLDPERTGFDAWYRGLSADDRYYFDSEGRGYKKDATHMMWLSWQAAVAAERERRSTKGAEMSERDTPVGVASSDPFPLE